MKIADARVIITGAASGLGRCFALNFAGAGAKVLAFDRDEGGLNSLQEEAPEIVVYKGNVADLEDVQGALAKAADSFGSVNGLVNNAGVFRDALLARENRKTGQVDTMSLDDWNLVLDVNLTGTFLFAREVAAQMIEEKTGGVIVNISSVSRHGNRGQTNYSATKSAVVAMTKLWGEELARYGIRTGAVAPGFTQTPILDGMRPEMLDKMLSAVPLRRAAKPEEIYQGVKFIFECDYFTARCIDIDGGVSL